VIDRRVEPEWLDELPAEDPRAVRSRRDLRLMNRIMGHGAIIGRVLRERLIAPAPRIAELGAGDGTLLARIAAAERWTGGATVVLVDRQPVVSTETRARYDDAGCRLGVDTADVFDWLARSAEPFDAIVANLFLHHFQAPQLETLFQLASARTGLFVACEPRRARLPLVGSHMLGLIGCCDVTRHDAVLSVRAGFGDRELSALWAASGWAVEERPAGVFSHLFTAFRASRTAAA
jgi:2-polyprenyl-3-methyl-5-hydroxy-6-metoxy-1,4-benzoquinol methylase